MGIEQSQIAAVDSIFKGTQIVPALNANLMSPVNKTPNQRALAAAIALGWSRISKGVGNPPMQPKTAQAQVTDLFRAMALAGHQAVGASFGNEQGAPDPHASLWMAALGLITLESIKQGLTGIQALAIGYWADHVALIRSLWTPAGYRTPCARAWASTGLTGPIRPSWTADSVAYATILGMPTKGLGNVGPWPWVIDLLKASSALFPEIVTKAKTATPKLSIPVRRWATAGGGFTAALAQDVALNERCSWITVDAKGGISGADQSLSTLKLPTGAPEAIGGKLAV